MHIERHTFSLTDSTGQTHTYETFPHGALEGLKVLNYLIAAGAEPLAKLVTSTLGPDMSLASLVTGDVPLSSLDLTQMGTALKNVVGDHFLDVATDVMRHTTRDGQALTQMTMDVAYRQNYVEFYRALWEIIRVNRFFPGLTTSDGTP